MPPKQQNLTIDYYYLERLFISIYLRNIVFIVIIIIILSFALLASILALLPVEAQEQIKLEALSEQGTFRVEIMWISNHIGSPNTFELHFIDPDTGSEIEDIKYDISIYGDNNTQEFRRLDQVSTVQQISFEEQGSYEIRIDDIEDLGEGVTIPIMVTSEFQHEVFIFAAAAVGLALIATLKPISKYLLGSSSTNRMASSIFFIALLLAAIFSITIGAAYAQGGGMMQTTSKGTLDVRLEPVWSDGGQANFNVSFLNPGTGTPHQHQDYDFRILKDGQTVFSAANQTGQPVLHNVEGTLTVPFTFPQNGDYTIQVHLAGTGIAPTIPTDEDATFAITVAPEFPAGILAAVLAASMTTAIVLARRGKLF